VHISNIRERESFRHFSYIEDVAAVHVIGEGVPGYARAVDLLVEVISGRADG
jgi:3-dehydroquinate dehydratase-2